MTKRFRQGGESAGKHPRGVGHQDRGEDLRLHPMVSSSTGYWVVLKTAPRSCGHKNLATLSRGLLAAGGNERGTAADSRVGGCWKPSISGQWLSEHLEEEVEAVGLKPEVRGYYEEATSRTPDQQRSLCRLSRCALPVMLEETPGSQLHSCIRIKALDHLGEDDLLFGMRSQENEAKSCWRG